ncbi:MAG TPA: histidine kinase dimerization/phospho-acceptor domain-containing protein, partial [Sphingomicrobium sp.]|nr:histidine kinase dimerization/phospho-acceptor domain-containing protein [Sphingomicrobium sp.]
RRDTAVRWRQLVDLVARAGSSAASPTVAQALESIAADAPNVDDDLRAAAARAVASLPLPLGLLEYFVSDGLAVSAPVLAAATLEPTQWQAILRGADEETRRFVETLHPGMGGEVSADLTDTLVEQPVEVPAELETEPETEPGAEPETEPGAKPKVEPQAAVEQPAESAAELPAERHPDAAVERAIEELKKAFAEPPRLPKPSRPAPASTPSLHEVVQRIERRRRTRTIMQRGGFTPRPQVSPALFRWECGPGGEIAWVDGAPRGALIGRSLSRAHSGEGDRVDPDVVRAFMVRAPFRDAALSVAGDGLVSGEWKISGVPAFDPADGRFRGYRGVALREREEREEAEEVAQALADPDSLRELVHEIKTPLNAIIGFAEIIEGQYLGPAGRRYRERAQEIVRQARLLLTAIDDLDFAAKVHSSSAGAQQRVNLGELVERIMPALRELAGAREIEVEAPKAMRDATAATEPELADRLIFRMCIALVEQADARERLRLDIERAGDRWRLSMTRPTRLAGIPDEELFGSEADFEHGFSLRLVRGLGRIAGADLEASKGTISLLFPRA